jgi:hypothetical protein
VKKLSAIIFSLVLVLAQFAPMQTASACAKPAMNCSDACRQMPCCAAKNSSDSQRAPAIPAQPNFQNQIPFLVPSVAAWILPENFANLFSSISKSSLMATVAPLYARNCALLL